MSDDLLARRRAAALEQVGGGEQDPRRAEAALEGVVRAERLLQRAPLEPLDGLDLGAVGLHGEQQAGADGDAVEPDGAGAADAVLAADVRAGQPERVAQEVGEQQARLDLFAVAPPVDGDVDHVTRPTARSTSTRTSWRW